MEGETIRDAILAVTGTSESRNRRPARARAHRAGSLRSDLHRTRARRALAGESGQNACRTAAAFISTTNAACGCRCCPPSISRTLSRPARCVRSARMLCRPFAVQQRLHAGAVARPLPRVLKQRCKLGTGPAKSNSAWQLALARVALAGRTKLAKKFLTNGGSLPDLCLALLNRNEFVYVP